MNTVEGLKEARHLVRSRIRWAKGHGGTKRAFFPSSYCIYTACLSTSIRGDADLEKSLRALGMSSREAMVFNDDPTTKHKDVIALFDRAIERAS